MNHGLTFDGEPSYEDDRTEPNGIWNGIWPETVVIVRGGRYNGCILTYLGRDRLGAHVCEHSEHCGGLVVPNVEPLTP